MNKRQAFPASPLAPLSGPQYSLLLRLARGLDPCRGRDARPVKYLVERGLARIDSLVDRSPFYVITPAGRRFIAMGKVRG